MPADAPTMPEVNAPAVNPSASKQIVQEYQRSDLRNTPEFKEVFKGFRAKAGVSPEPAAPKPAPAKPKPEPPKPQVQQPKPEPELGEDPDETTTTTEPPSEEPETPEAPAPDEKPEGEEAKPAAPEKGKKLSPWRLVDQWKAKASDLEKQLAEIKTKAIPEADSKALTERLQQAETKLKEYEDEIRYVNYQKSPEFLEKYHKPYETAFKRAVAELSEVPVLAADGSSRPATAEDMLSLVSLPLGKAREVAKEMFGDFADDAMAHRKEIKALFEQRQAAIEEARTKGAEREKQATEQTQRQQAEVVKHISETWNKAQQEAVTHEKYGKYFTPRESDPDWNQRLAKGFELVDKAFNDANPRDPRLTPEDREKVIRRHAAVRHRAAAFGPLRYENEKLSARVAELEKQLSEYKGSEPGSGGGSRTNKPKGESNDAWDRVKQGLRKYASK